MNEKITRSYFLGTGPKEYYYTLWSRVTSPQFGTYCYYQGNLAHEYEAARAKATEKTGQTSWQHFDISEYRRANGTAPDLTLAPDQVVLTFGKYAGETVATVAECDLGYLLFLALKSDWAPTKASFARPLNYIRAMFRAEAAKREEQRKADIQAQRDADNAARADLPAAGRQLIVGTVISLKEQESQFGLTWKMLVEHQSGWKVWGTVPGNILGTIDRGHSVSLTAKIEPSGKDRSFGFFSRPTGARNLSLEAAQPTVEEVQLN